MINEFFTRSVLTRYRHSTSHSKTHCVGVCPLAASSCTREDSKAGVERHQNFKDNDKRRKKAPRLRNIRKQRVLVSQDIRNAAADWALSKAGEGYDNPGAGYKYNFAFNKDVNDDAFNCASLVWAAYMVASKNSVDLDKDGGTGVYPSDIRDSPFVEDY